MPPASDDPAVGRRAEIRLDDGRTLVVRPLVPADRDLLVEGFEHLSPESRYHRFFSPMHELGPHLLVQLTDLDYHDRFAWIALVRDGDSDTPAAVVRYFAQHDHPGAVELAITVVDEFQGLGIGSLLVQLVARTAAANGFSVMSGQVLAENAPMRALLHSLGAQFGAPSAGVLDFSVDLASMPEPADPARADAVHRLATGTAAS